MSNIKIAIIGAGASGLAAAVFTSHKAKSLGVNADICLFESNSRVGKKILVTGNGRCNFTNENVSASHFRGESDFAYKVYSRFDSVKAVEFFRTLGLYSKSDASGRVYPLSFQATSVLDVLRHEISKNNVKEITDTKVTSLKRSGKGFLINGSFYADKVILATGGKAAPVQGSDGSGFNLLSEMCLASSRRLDSHCMSGFYKGTQGNKGTGHNISEM